MKHAHFGFLCSSMVALLAVPYMANAAGIRVGNASRSYAAAYDQVNAIRNPGPASIAVQTGGALTDSAATVAVVTPTQLDLPLRVADNNLAETLSRGESVGDITMDRLEQCAMIYPDGEFAWDKATAGMGVDGKNGCVAVVEMRGYQMGPNGEDLVVARANVRTGDGIKCNISSWPESSYLPAAEQITFPADSEPTIDDVKRVMNKEQQQNAGIKIAAGTLVAAVAGNMVGESEVGKSSLIGTNKAKMKSTAIGGLTGAAIMAGNVYGGKVAGDMILSAGVNAAAGAVVGNMAAAGDSVLRIEKCKTPSNQSGTESCLWGLLVASKDWAKDNGHGVMYDYYFNTATEDSLQCEQSTEDGAVGKNCKPIDLISIQLADYDDKQTLEEIASKNYNQSKHSYAFKDGKVTEYSGIPDITGNNSYVKIVSARIPTKQYPALIVGFQDKPFGKRKKDWASEKAQIDPENIKGRDPSGDAYELADDIKKSATIKNFYPMYEDASDGGLIDLDNKARLKSTLIGAGAGGALGAFTAYQGAQTDIENRWVTEVRAYKDSLQKVYCATGNRFLSHYNDVAVIPNENIK